MGWLGIKPCGHQPATVDLVFNLETLCSPSHPQLDFQPGQGDYRVYIVNLDLARGSSYFMRIYATNGAGLESFR